VRPSTNQVLAQIGLWTNHGKYEEQGLRAAETLRREGRCTHLDKLGVKLTSLSVAQADYLGLPLAGPLQA
jgi:adenosylhomocysteinase